VSKDINQILKSGKLTGEEVGRLMIKDMIIAFKGSVKLKHKELKGLLSHDQMNALVDRLTGGDNIRAYNDYKALHDFLTTAPILLFAQYQIAEIAYWQLTYLFHKLDDAENENRRIFFQPRIMTQKQYDELRKANFERKMTFTASIEELIFHALEYYRGLYEKGEQTPLNKYFNKTKKEPLANPRIKANYWEEGENGYYVTPDGRTSKDMSVDEWAAEVKKAQADKGVLKWVEDQTAPEDATKWDVLEYASGFYESTETDNTATLWEFKADYPELYNALLTKLASMKGLSFIKNTPEKDYFKEGVIAYKDLYRNKILDYLEIIERLDGGADGKVFLGGVAVLQPTLIVPTKGINEQGHYVGLYPYWRKQHMAEDFLEHRAKDFTTLLDRLKEALKECFVLQEAIRLFAEYTNIPEITVVVDDAAIDRMIYLVEGFNALMVDMPFGIGRYGFIDNERPVDELKAELADIFKPIDIDALKPSQQAIQKAKAIMSFDIVKGDTERLYKILRGQS